MSKRANAKGKLNRKPGQGGVTVAELLFAFLMISVIGAMAVPGFISIARNLRSSGDARDINDEIGLAKMRAAADFTRTRVYADLAAQTFHIEVWNKAGAGAWVTEGGTQFLSEGVAFGFGGLSSPPSGTQASIGQAPACLNNTGGSIANTACVVFNSRGIPIDSTGTPTANDAIYITDGSSVYAMTVSATGLIRTWRSDVKAGNWQIR